MENKSHTQNKSKEDILAAIKENLNYIYVVLLMIVSMLLNCLRIEDGHVGVNFPKDLMSWGMWGLQIALTTTMGVLILNAFRRQGIKNGHKAINDTYQAYLSVLDNPVKSKKPRSLKQYMTTKISKDSISKAITFTIVTCFTGTVLISFNANNLLGLGVNLIMAIAFGIKAMLEAETYVVTELVTWYKLETEKLKKEIEDGKRNMCRTRPNKSNRIQPKEECGTRQHTQSIVKSSQRVVRRSSCGLSPICLLWTYKWC